MGASAVPESSGHRVRGRAGSMRMVGSDRALVSCDRFVIEQVGAAGRYMFQNLF